MIFIGICGEPLQDGHPNIVRTDLNLAVIEIGMIEGIEEAVGRLISALRCLLVEDDFATLKLAYGLFAG